MTGTNCDLFTHNQSRSYLNHLVHPGHCYVTDLSGLAALRKYEQQIRFSSVYLKYNGWLYLYSHTCTLNKSSNIAVNFLM
jgi:hypothetical protein